jgi:hypothetical protein
MTVLEAAMIVAAKVTARVTYAGFVIFVIASVAWLARKQNMPCDPECDPSFD